MVAIFLPVYLIWKSDVREIDKKTDRQRQTDTPRKKKEREKLGDATNPQNIVSHL